MTKFVHICLRRIHLSKGSQSFLIMRKRYENMYIMSRFQRPKKDGCFFLNKSISESDIFLNVLMIKLRKFLLKMNKLFLDLRA